MDLNHARLPIPPLRHRCFRLYTGCLSAVNDLQNPMFPLMV